MLPLMLSGFEVKDLSEI